MKMEKIVLNNRSFVLVPEEEWAEVEDLLKYYLGGATPESSIKVDGEDIRKATPKVSEYRERFKKRELTADDVSTKTSPLKLYQFGQDEFARFTDDGGGSLFFGKGLENDY